MKTKSDLAALRYFLAVAEHGSFSKAASSLRITQPAISRQVQHLEQSYHTRLFRREGRRFEATEAGKQLILEAQSILERYDALNDVIGVASREPSGVLTVGSTWAAGESLLPPALARFCAKYPKVFLRLVQDSSDRLADALVSRKIDLAVLYHRPREVELDFGPLIEVELGLIAPAAGRDFSHEKILSKRSLRLSEAARLPLILPQKGQVLRDLIESHCVEQKVAPLIVMESDSLPLSKSLVLAGHGCTILALGGVYEEVARSELRFIPIRAPTIPWRMYLATSKTHSQTLALKAMQLELSSHIRSSAMSLRWNGRVL